MVGEPGAAPAVDRAGARARLAEIGRAFHLRLDPDALVGDLTIGEQQRLEIVKALCPRRPHPDPRRADGDADAAGDRRAVRRRARHGGEGMGVIFISHKLQRGARRSPTASWSCARARVVAETANDGDRHRAPARRADVRPRADAAGASRRRQPGRVLLRLDRHQHRGRASAGACKDLSLDVRAGEIVGIAGVSGNGQRELADVIAGVLTPLRGTDRGRRPDRRPARSARDARRCGIGRIPEDRIGTGLIDAVCRSPTAWRCRGSARPPFSRHGMLDRARHPRLRRGPDRASSPSAPPDPMARTGTLSGGNLQKALLARELAWDPLIAARRPADPRPRCRRHRVRPRQVPRAARRRPRPARHQRGPRGAVPDRRPHRRDVRAAGSSAILPIAEAERRAGSAC